MYGLVRKKIRSRPGRTVAPLCRHAHPLLAPTAAFACFLLGLSPSPVRAATTLENIEYSADITVEVGLPAVVVADEEIAIDDLSGTVVAMDLGAIPTAADVTGYHVAANGDLLFSTDLRVDLGGVVAGRADVLRLGNSGYEIEFSASEAGVPASAAVDAIASGGDGIVVLSFDTTVELPGGILADDEDLVEYDGADFRVVFDGSMSGVPTSVDIDAAHLLDDGGLLLSFDTGGEIGGVPFEQGDVLETDDEGVAWELAVDVSSMHAGWGAANLDAVYAEVAPSGTCADVNDNGNVTAVDALLVLQAAVGTRECLLCVCDITGDGRILAADALATLKYAVGLSVALNCPACS